MPNWSGGILTTRGQALQAKVDAGQTTLTFTKMKIGSGVLGSGQSLEDLTDLITPKQNIGISGISASGNITTLTGVITNAGVTTGYQVRELGVFATDPALGEILYSVTIDSAPDYLPPEGGAVAVSQEFNYKIAVSNAANVSATISTSGLVTVGMLQSHNHNGIGTNGPRLGSSALLDGAATDLVIGNRIITDTVTAAAGSDTPTNLWSKLGNMIKQITGKATWWTPPATTLEAANTHITAATGAHAASAISLTPTGDVSANTVQAGIAELAAEKLAAMHALNGATCFYRDLVGYTSGSSYITGTIKILLPVGWAGTNTMMTLDISGYHHGSTPNSFTALISAYARSVSTEWLYPNAVVSSGSPITSVRFGYDSVAGKPCILLGTTASSWNNLYLVVKEMVAGQNNTNNYSSGWTASLITDETGITGIVTATVKTLATVEGSIAPYGLGTYVTQYNGDLNSLNTATGFYYASTGSTNRPTANNGFILVEVLSATYATQTFTDVGTNLKYTRRYAGGIWDSWKQISTMDLVAPAGYGLGTAAILATGDWNNYLTTGFFRGAYLANSPPPTAQYFVMVIRYDDNYVTQEAWSFAGTAGLKYFRTKTSGVWSAWNQITTTDTMGHIGDVKYTLSSTPPPGWLKANGAAVSRTTYAALFAAMGTVFGAGDGSTTFNLPDLRGEFIRGWDDGRGIDASRALGSSQLDALQNITGNISAQVGGADMGGNGAFGANNSGNITKVGLNTGVSGSTTGLKFDSSLVVRTATETRPRNVALLACIKY
ncbi:tail fiber protein [Anaerospora hongkongensis]|uniref:tail fiber protein n=1 Tax=Anaerospora hongkongensis TaxID=244830 RepID=UPI002FDAD66C